MSDFVVSHDRRSMRGAAVVILIAVLAGAMAAPSPVDRALVEQADTLVAAGKVAEALAEYDRAVARDGRDLGALTGRAFARAKNGDLAGAKGDLAIAATIDPDDARVLGTLAAVADFDHRPADAVALYSKIIDRDPASRAYGRRAQAYAELGDDAAALADCATMARLDPAWRGGYLIRESIFAARGETGRAVAEVDAWLATAGKDADAIATAGVFYGELGRIPAAMAAFDRSIAIRPLAGTYLSRSLYRPARDYGGRRADLDRALVLDPQSAGALSALAGLQAETGDFAAAVATYTRAIALLPGDRGLLEQRGMARVRAGGVATAGDADFTAAAELSASPEALLILCRKHLTRGIGLTFGLADCDAAVAQAPEVTAYREMRGMARLRLDRLDDARADFDAVIAGHPDAALALFGRSVIAARRGDALAAAADRRAAIASAPDIAAFVRSLGID